MERPILGLCNMCTCSGNGTQERAVQDLQCLVDLYLVIGFDFSSATVSESDRLCYRIAMFSLLCWKFIFRIPGME